jgi:hypothetical protein
MKPTFGRKGDFMKLMILAAILTSFLSLGVQAQDFVEVTETLRRCQEDEDFSARLILKAQKSAETKCLGISGYPTATIEGAPKFTQRVLSFGYLGCSLISNVTIQARFVCSNRN